jgi:hypothetical protein
MLHNDHLSEGLGYVDNYVNSFRLLGPPSMYFCLGLVTHGLGDNREIRLWNRNGTHLLEEYGEDYVCKDPVSDAEDLLESIKEQMLYDGCEILYLRICVS